MMEEFIKKITFYKLVDKVPTPCKLFELNSEELEKHWNVKKSQITPDVLVSTIFIGTNINLFGSEPVFFETMVFGGPLDQKRIHSSTWDEAVEVHDKMCLKVIDAF